MTARAKKRFLTGGEAVSPAQELAETLYKIPALLTTRTRCGKPNCRCASGRPHGPYHVLYWREGTIQRRRYVRARDVPDVRAILAQRRAERHAERLAHAMSLRTWRELAHWVVDYEARVRTDQERP